VGARVASEAMFRTLRPLQLFADLVIAGLFALVTLPLELSGSTAYGMGDSILGGLAVGFALATAVAFRRLAPGLALAVAWTAAVMQMSLGLSPRLTDVAILAVLYTTAAYGSRLVYWLGLASAVVGAVVITLYLSLPGAGLSLVDLSTTAALLTAALFGLLLAWVTGALVRVAARARETRRAQIRAEDDTAAEQERVRIARDMHDVVAHSLAVVIAQADGARYAAAADPEATNRALTTISTTARAALADVRLLLTQLRHSEGAGPQPTLADVEALYAQVRAAGVELSVEVDPMPPADPPASAQLAVYRILQEALTNALRHGGGAPVAVRLAWHEGEVELVVRNPVAGAADAAGQGHGLIGMRERAQLAGGRLDAGAEGDGWVVRAVLPMDAVREVAP
jgi:signal transduction histidine kinase